MKEVLKGQSMPVVALAGNPNVGKSTVFNALTGLRQHTGNWPGKTVALAEGRFSCKGQAFRLVDLPGAYSLAPNSAEEETARDFICFDAPRVTVVVADATCLERSLGLLLQVMELSKHTVLCVNLLDEAAKKQLRVDLGVLRERLGIPVVGTSARSGKGVSELAHAVYEAAFAEEACEKQPVAFCGATENALIPLEAALRALPMPVSARFAALRLLENDQSAITALFEHSNVDLSGVESVALALEKAREELLQSEISQQAFRDLTAAAYIEKARALAGEAVAARENAVFLRDARIDRLFTSRFLGPIAMLALLFFVLWLTIAGANYPSALLSKGLFALLKPLSALFDALKAPFWLSDLIVNGVYKTLAWVVAVMLPPMAIFFPLFTLLEDWGYLPRVAFNLDNAFSKAGAHGKQSLTTCMGLGCNACGVTGCRIIDSPRERLIAMLTNNFMPCNGRMPLLIALTAMFFAGAAGGALSSSVPALMLTLFLAIGMAATLLSAKLLSKTLLRGVKSSFQLELPPYRRPQFFKVLLRSLLDRTVFVLGRAISVAAPAGALIWLLANARPEGVSLLARCAAFFEPLGKLMGMDGIILLAFLLALPANEIVIPLIIMGYTSTGSLGDYESLASLRALFVAHGWTAVTALCVMLFSLLHWPCGTTLLTIKKETNSLKWTLVSFLLPTAWGVIVCMAVAFVAGVVG